MYFSLDCIALHSQAKAETKRTCCCVGVGRFVSQRQATGRALLQPRNGRLNEPQPFFALRKDQVPGLFLFVDMTPANMGTRRNLMYSRIAPFGLSCNNIFLELPLEDHYTPLYRLRLILWPRNTYILATHIVQYGLDSLTLSIVATRCLGKACNHQSFRARLGRIQI